MVALELMDTGTLYIVATPIGNMEDITLRALRIFSEVAYVLSEDTRVTGNLLKHHGIAVALKRYDAHASERVHDAILEDLKAGKSVALVSDAGTPGVSDPGVLLVRDARKAGIRVDAIPGASAVTAAFSIAGISGNAFTFLGFAPQKKGRQTFFAALGDAEHPVMFFESTHRIMKTFEALLLHCPTMRITVLRELTKFHEEVFVGFPGEVIEYFKEHTDHQKGEFVIIVSS